MAALLTASGFVNKLISSSNKDMALEAAILHHTLNIRKLEMDDIRRGMETISLVSFLNKNRELWHSVHAFPQTNQVTISAATLESKLVLHSSVKLDEINEQEKQAFELCKEYVRTLPGNMLDVLFNTCLQIRLVRISISLPFEYQYVYLGRSKRMGLIRGE